jgi:hypothetical protein
MEDNDQLHAKTTLPHKIAPSNRLIEESMDTFRQFEHSNEKNSLGPHWE